MWIAMLLVTVSASPGTTREQFFRDLAHWREQFETVLKEPSEEIGYTHVDSEMLGGAHGEGLYPVGSASERYVISLNEAGAGGMLIYEKRRGNHASVVWHLPFRPTKGTHTVVGTVGNYLQTLGFEIPRQARLTPSIQRQLSAGSYFAHYSYHPMNGGFADVIAPDGKCTQTRKSSERFSITPEEKKLLEDRSGIRQSVR